MPSCSGFDTHRLSNAWHRDIFPRGARSSMVPRNSSDPISDKGLVLMEAMSNPRVVIVGAGFGGLSAAKALASKSFEVTVIDQHNYHLFQPLLYQVATAGLSPADIASPIRSVLRGQSNTSVMLAKVTGVDMARNEVVIGARRVPFDFLVLATGARHAYFGNDDWE